MLIIKHSYWIIFILLFLIVKIKLIVEDLYNFKLNFIENFLILLYQYLGETFDRSLCNKTCDNCKNEKPVKDVDITDDCKNIIKISIYFLIINIFYYL